MPIIRLQGEAEIRDGIYFEFDSSEHPLGEGGMGKVYRGRCVNERTRSSRDVAIKFMFDDMPDHVIERARREASIRLRNDNLVEMLGFIETGEKNVLGEIKKHYHVVSELLCGVMLDDLIKGKITDQFGNEVSFAAELYSEMRIKPYKFAIRVIRNILQGLMALHNAGYIHRDIDPTNIMVTNDRKIKLIDFGICKQLRSLNTHDKALTASGQFIGKPWYAAPELVLGDIKHQNQTTDIYAIGILLFQLVIGYLPFDGAHHEVLSMQLKKKMPLGQIRRKYGKIADVIGKATQKEQSKRYQSVSEFMVSVEQLPEQPLSPKQVPWKIIGAASLGAASVIGCIALWQKPYVDENDKTDTAFYANSSTSSLYENAYENYVEMLKNPKTAGRGLELLDSLSNIGCSEASYLLSRIYFESEKKGDYCSQEIIDYKNNLNDLPPDNKKAHELLNMAVSSNSSDYKSLYELGCDYLGGEQRNKFVKRDIKKAYTYFKQAKELAEKKNDVLYTNLISKKLDGYDWESILGRDFKKKIE